MNTAAKLRRSLVKNSLVAISAFIIFPFFVPAQGVGPADEVDPLIGTAKSSHRTVWESNGATFPGVLVPFGMVQITPDAYHYTDTQIRGFSYLDHHSGWGSGGSFLIMPYIGPDFHPSSFVHDREQSHPWQYDVDLADFGIHASFTATAHAGLARFSFPASGQSHILITDVSGVKFISDTSFTGQSHGTWFIAFSSRPFRWRPEGTNEAPRKTGPVSGNISASSGNPPANGKDSAITGKDPLAAGSTSTIPGSSSEVRLDYTTTAGEVIDIRIGFSETSFDAAARNLLQEMPDNDFEKISRETKKVWNDRLSRIEIKGNDLTHRKVFYTALYHASFMPRIISDAGETPRRYTPLYPWDTYRSEHPLIALLDPLAEGDMITGVLENYDRTGWLPTGNMLGNHNVELILDAYNKGIRNFDAGKAAQAIRKSLLEPPYARRDMDSYNRLGYVPAFLVNSVSQTLEFAYNDWAGAGFLKLAGENGLTWTGKDSGQMGPVTDQTRTFDGRARTVSGQPAYASDADSLLRRSYNYRHVFDAATNFMRARTDSGGWTSGGYCEGTEWTYTWYVPQDVRGLAHLMGGNQAFSHKLNECLEKGYYVHDNEPPLHYAYLFDFIGQPWKTQQWARHITENSYSADPGGLPGNDDLGALSSWYIFSVIGFYPVTPGCPVYEIGSPLFEECILHLSNGNQFSILAPGNSATNKYIQRATLNGQPYMRPWLSHKDILAGGVLILHMGPQPNQRWGAAPEEAPPSQTSGEPDLQPGPAHLSASSTDAGQAVEWSCPISNKGLAAGSRQLDVYVDSRPYSTVHILVDPGDTRLVTLPILLYHAGSHKITLGKMNSPQLLFVREKAPSFVYRDLFMPLPSLFHRTDSFPVRAKVKNTGSRSAVTPITLYLNHHPFRTNSVILQPGQEKEVSFQLSGADCTPLSAIGIGDLPASIVRILDQDAIPPTSSSLLHHLGAAMVMDFDQGPSEQITDISGAGNNGKVHGNVKWVDGLFGKAIQTDATKDSYIEILSNSAMDSLAHSEALTMMAWIYPTEEENFADIICKGDWDALQIKGSNTVVNFCTGGWEGHEAFSAVPSGWNRHWHHIAGVTRQPYEELYIDGRLVAVKKMEPRDPNGETGTADYSHNTWNIGRNETDHTRIFKGYIDDVMIFRKALTAADINRLMLHVPE